MLAQSLIESILHNEDASARRRSAEELMKIGSMNTAIIQAFVHGLTDSDKGVRDICALGLTQSYSEFNTDKARFVAPLITHTNIEVRNLAGDILLKYGEYAADALMEYVQDTKADNRKFACDIIGLSGNNQAIPAIKNLLTDTDTNVRYAAIEALGHLKAVDSVGDIIAMYKADEDVRPYVIDALGRIGGKEGQNFLLTVMNEADEFLQATAIDALATCADDVDIAHRLLERLPEVDNDMQLVLLKAIYGIAYRLHVDIALPEQLRFLAHQAMADDDDDIQIAGLLALGGTLYINDVPALIQEIQRNNSGTQQHIISILLANSSAEVVDNFLHAVFRVCKDGNLQVVDILGYVNSVWANARSENAKQVLKTVVNFYPNIHNADQRREVLEFLLSVSREHLLSLLSSELRSEQADRVEDARQMIDFYNIKEIVR